MTKKIKKIIFTQKLYKTDHEIAVECQFIIVWLYNYGIFILL